MDRYTVLNLIYEFEGTEQRLYPTVLFGASDVVLVDCGYPGSLPLLEEALERQAVPPSSLTKLLLTHQDDDHMGAAMELKAKYPHIQIAASALEAPYISGAKKNLRLAQAEALQAQLPEAQKTWGESFCQRLRQVPPVPVDILLQPGSCFDWGGGCEIVSTPGHTPGHLSIYLIEEDAFITGDAAVIENGALTVANPQFCLDLPAAETSLEMVKAKHCRTYICYHGGFLGPPLERPSSDS